jgi:hypothetical protein
VRHDAIKAERLKVISQHLIRGALILQAALFAAASVLHSGALITGYEHGRAQIAETVIAVALLAGAAVSLVRPHLLRLAALIAQGVALLGTFVGLFTIAIGIGPQTSLDLSIHALMIAVLAAGLLFTARSRMISA